MKIWVDADGCPLMVREIVLKAADRLKQEVSLVANQYIHLPQRRWVTMIQVPSGQDVADSFIVEQVQPGDLVITSDIPFAARAIERGAVVLSHRGEVWTEANVRERLSVRDFMTELRDSGVMTGGPRPLGAADKRRFASAFDSTLARLRRG